MHISLVVILLGFCDFVHGFPASEFTTALTQSQHLIVIYSVFALIGFAKGFYSPAGSSLKPFLVPRDDLP
jgi:hypothetical protein